MMTYTNLLIAEYRLEMLFNSMHEGLVYKPNLLAHCVVVKEIWLPKSSKRVTILDLFFFEVILIFALLKIVNNPSLLCRNVRILC